MKLGELGSLDSGNFFLCRHEDRIMWIQVGIVAIFRTMYHIDELNLHNNSSNMFSSLQMDLYRFLGFRKRERLRCLQPERYGIARN